MLSAAIPDIGYGAVDLLHLRPLASKERGWPGAFKIGDEFIMPRGTKFTKQKVAGNKRGTVNWGKSAGRSRQYGVGSIYIHEMVKVAPFDGKDPASGFVVVHAETKRIVAFMDNSTYPDSVVYDFICQVSKSEGISFKSQGVIKRMVLPEGYAKGEVMVRPSDGAMYPAYYTVYDIVDQKVIGEFRRAPIGEDDPGLYIMAGSTPPMPDNEEGFYSPEDRDFIFRVICGYAAGTKRSRHTAELLAQPIRVGRLRAYARAKMGTDINTAALAAVFNISHVLDDQADTIVICGLMVKFFETAFAKDPSFSDEPKIPVTELSERLNTFYSTEAFNAKAVLTMLYGMFGGEAVGRVLADNSTSFSPRRYIREMERKIATFIAQTIRQEFAEEINARAKGRLFEGELVELVEAVRKGDEDSVEAARAGFRAFLRTNMRLAGMLPNASDPEDLFEEIMDRAKMLCPMSADDLFHRGPPTGPENVLLPRVFPPPELITRWIISRRGMIMAELKRMPLAANFGNAVRMFGQADSGVWLCRLLTPLSQEDLKSLADFPVKIFVARLYGGGDNWIMGRYDINDESVRRSSQEARRAFEMWSDSCRLDVIDLYVSNAPGQPSAKLEDFCFAARVRAETFVTVGGGLLRCDVGDLRWWGVGAYVWPTELYESIQEDLRKGAASLILAGRPSPDGNGGSQQGNERLRLYIREALNLSAEAAVDSALSLNLKSPSGPWFLEDVLKVIYGQSPRVRLWALARLEELSRSNVIGDEYYLNVLSWFAMRDPDENLRHIALKRLELEAAGGRMLGDAGKQERRAEYAKLLLEQVKSAVSDSGQRQDEAARRLLDSAV
ncbi:MAG: hypothetical protein HY589_02935 [Candidatus Omnitrophica bacterium]|nr:hypothetical protein [Candidatus Omnitrophota bacterium]